MLMKTIFINETPFLHRLKEGTKNSGRGTFLKLMLSSIQGLNAFNNSLVCTDSVVKQHDR